MGGGNGLSTLLRGLKRYARLGEDSVDITAVVTVTDDGGSSGRLRREFDVLPPGDIRNCMVALSRDETFMARLFQYRFTNGRGLKGHSFGNLFLTAMTHLTGDFPHAVQYSTQVLGVLGQIFPATAADVSLEATLANGKKIAGETRISKSRSRIESVALKPAGKVKPLAETLKAIASADLITLGPGSLFTSVIPNLLVDGIPQALARSGALKVYFVNLMSQPGETSQFTAADHVAAVLRHFQTHKSKSQDSKAAEARCPLDICVVNTASIRGQALGHYQARAARPIENDFAKLQALGVEVIEADLLRLNRRQKADKIRHDSGAIGAIAIELAQRGRWRILESQKAKV